MRNAECGISVVQTACNEKCLSCPTNVTERFNICRTLADNPIPHSAFFSCAVIPSFPISRFFQRRAGWNVTFPNFAFFSCAGRVTRRTVRESNVCKKCYRYSRVRMRRYTDLSRKPISPKARFLPRGGRLTFGRDCYIINRIAFVLKQY